MNPTKHIFKYTLHNGIYGGECKHCKQDYKFKVTTQCPEVKLCDDITKRVQSGQIDLVDGSWVRLKPTESIGDMLVEQRLGVVEPKQKETKPKVTIVDSVSLMFKEMEHPKEVKDAISSLFAFMDAMVPELSSEANNELTDEDIELLRNINSVPLPVSCVSGLELPVDQLVSLHKLKRLNYVTLLGNGTNFVITHSYKITSKGKEFLQPKPITITLSAACWRLLLKLHKGSEHESDIMHYGYKKEFLLIRDTTPLICPSILIRNNWELSPIGRQYVNEVLDKELTFI